ncbi:MAG: methylated-DNA-[protein]-cysteine S-methyltransferase [Actinomycetota bacterium]|jgi:methylated-DNA-[protein]-cysteine S-methyltransferase|nr:methylated-DNA-[protein]-cysteine S-methyltransferase [Actinomycetota bacterium]
MEVLRYRKLDSVLGHITIAASSAGVCLIGLGSEYRPSTPGFELEPGDGAIIDDAAEAVTSYLTGTTTTFDLPLDLMLATPFCQSVLKHLLDVPYGELTTYGALAAAAGTSARAVGGAVGANPIPIVIPCHRVVAADGSLGGFSAGLERKRTLLALEGHAPMKGGWAPRRRKVFA